MSFSIVAAPTSIHTNTHRGSFSTFSHILANACNFILIIAVLKCEVVSHCGLGLYIQDATQRVFKYSFSKCQDVLGNVFVSTSVSKQQNSPFPQLQIEGPHFSILFLWSVSEPGAAFCIIALFLCGKSIHSLMF